MTTYYAVTDIKLNGIDDMYGLEPVYHSFLPLVRTAELESDLKAINPTLATLSVHKSYPHTLIITARAQRPAVELVLTDGSAVLSNTGIVLAKYKNTLDEHDIPRLMYYQPLFYNQLSVGEKIDQPEIQVGAYFAEKVAELGTPVSTIDITNENMIVLHAETYNVIVTSQQDVELQSVRLAYTFTELHKKGKVFTSIDVRFERPIIVLQK